MVAEDNKPYPIDVEDHKTVTIVVEGTPHEWAEEYINYDQVVTPRSARLLPESEDHLHGDLQARPPQQARRHPLQRRHRQGRRRNDFQCYTNW